jgi:hypothetical protein
MKKLITILAFLLASVNLWGVTIPTGNRVELYSTTVTTATSINIISLINSSYDIYEIDMYDFVPSALGNSVVIRVSTDNGSTWINALIDRNGNRDGASYSVSNTNNYSVCNAITVVTTTQNICTRVQLFDFNNTIRWKQIFAQNAQWLQTGNHASTYSGATVKTTEALNAIQIKCSADCQFAGTVYFYGIASANVTIP